MITVIAYMLVVLTNLLVGTYYESDDVVVIPPMPMYAPSNQVSEESEWSEYWHDAYYEYLEEWDTLYSSYEVKRARNGVMMIRSGNSGRYSFAKKG